MQGAQHALQEEVSSSKSRSSACPRLGHLLQARCVSSFRTVPAYLQYGVHARLLRPLCATSAFHAMGSKCLPDPLPTQTFHDMSKPPLVDQTGLPRWQHVTQTAASARCQNGNAGPQRPWMQLLPPERRKLTLRSSSLACRPGFRTHRRWLRCTIRSTPRCVPYTEQQVSTSCGHVKHQSYTE